jgi:cytochrome c553
LKGEHIGGDGYARVHHSPDTYARVYSGWETVENAAIALADGVDLILTPGRLCQNGKPVPTRSADFQRFAQNMRRAGLAVLQAARTKNQEKVSDASNDLTDACSRCHEAYRDTGPADSPARCPPAEMTRRLGAGCRSARASLRTGATDANPAWP